MINGVISNKFNLMDEVLAELQSLGQVTTAQLDQDWKVRRAIERNLQILTEIVTDVCQRLISLSKQSPATTGADAINRCVAIGALSSPEPYRKMIQFRNFIVHRYEKVDTAILVEIINRRLSDFEAFREEISRYVYRMENT